MVAAMLPAMIAAAATAPATPMAPVWGSGAVKATVWDPSEMSSWVATRVLPPSR